MSQGNAQKHYTVLIHVDTSIAPPPSPPNSTPLPNKSFLSEDSPLEALERKANAAARRPQTPTWCSTPLPLASSTSSGPSWWLWPYLWGCFGSASHRRKNLTRRRKCYPPPPPLQASKAPSNHLICCCTVGAVGLASFPAMVYRGEAESLHPPPWQALRWPGFEEQGSGGVPACSNPILKQATECTKSSQVKIGRG